MGDGFELRNLYSAKSENAPRPFHRPEGKVGRIAMPLDSVLRNFGHFAHLAVCWAASEINRNREQGEHCEHLEAKPL